MSVLSVGALIALTLTRGGHIERFSFSRAVGARLGFTLKQYQPDEIDFTRAVGRAGDPMVCMYGGPRPTRPGGAFLAHQVLGVGGGETARHSGCTDPPLLQLDQDSPDDVAAVIDLGWEGNRHSRHCGRITGFAPMPWICSRRLVLV
jgi:hypothetical protein